MMSSLQPIACLWLGVASIIAFSLYGQDKRYAKMPGHRRTPERTLLLWAFFGGAPGAFLGMRVFHHKTRHRRFTILVPLFLVLQIAGLVYLFFR